MIVFDLQCSNGHTFEGWFEDSLAFDVQKKKGLISCPVCENTNILKLPSAFVINASNFTPEVSDSHVALKSLNRKIAEYVDKNFENVGCSFAKEALKMHYGVTEPKGIRGVSTDEEEKTLENEGINFFKVPAQVSPDAKT
ncbi:MAG: DUF1178 family protein [Deltaproteobacteria bacterium]|nr:DUF1178 family protein [Deltaproteobacteria bacterium]MBW2661527.1 DUF1178 family protein [Deltaproteobacteria bacterium]